MKNVFFVKEKFFLIGFVILIVVTERIQTTIILVAGKHTNGKTIGDIHEKNF